MHSNDVFAVIEIRGRDEAVITTIIIFSFGARSSPSNNFTDITNASFLPRIGNVYIEFHQTKPNLERTARTVFDVAVASASNSSNSPTISAMGRYSSPAPVWI